MEPLLVTTSCAGREDAERIARHVLTERLAACVQVSGPVSSSYWWRGEIVSEEEFIVCMKSARALFEPLAREIRNQHPYEVPEIVATALSAVDADYLAWLVNELA